MLSGWIYDCDVVFMWWRCVFYVVSVLLRKFCVVVMYSFVDCVALVCCCVLWCSGD